MKNLIFENTTIHNERINKSYIKSVTSNFKGTLLVMIGILLIMIIMALTGSSILWYVVGLIAICTCIVTFINIKGINNCKYSLEQFNGAVYHYRFYDEYVKIEYNFKNRSECVDVNYKLIKNVLLNDGVLAFNLSDNSLLFIDETTITDGEGYNKAKRLLYQYANDGLSNKKKRKRKND